MPGLVFNLDLFHTLLFHACLSVSIKKFFFLTRLIEQTQTQLHLLIQTNMVPLVIEPVLLVFAFQGILKSLKNDDDGDGDTDDGDDGADTILMFCLCCEIIIGQGLPLD